ncbi:ATP-binding cassette domain-containing protein, partial [Pantoea sp. SIMBA_079]|uniref:ATP-binding cassette domain-containing protein n=1 Tax=Pantoea sp. SIMBA_079 TaxID=3085817 RepID=UPI003993B5A2
MTAILELRDAGFRYRRAQAPALHGVSFSIESGRSVGLVGESGAGKTTALSPLLGLSRPTSGAVLFDSKPLDARDREQVRRFRRS